ncbi:MAG: hypothetical protein A3C61_02455 [Candidatus Yanofskybacteria bacterium RIFCSPHIGHO2_02_FULL_39_10]|uniref:Adenylate kinase n=1 Tax=Candidatus Yanofskybacteria bacterium RIFCSPHIGHO2_02_FULL_39_10 TaxID=1802674 RepID=A0A1F8F846_9BACT|nr:MAG: hypothetical protein A3C61_02455 [Candidatus Yanofskybacteria bacterium RIFCSPHIGHO2_02_FULL_39_10]
MNLTKKLLIFMGPVGSGKDTQAGILASKIDYTIFKSTQALENKFRNTKSQDSDYEDMLKEKNMWESGILLTPSWVGGVVNEATKKLINTGVKGIIFSGSPRTLPEAELEIPVLESFYGKDAIVVFKLHISGDESIKRNSVRLFCEHSHPIDPEVVKTNPTICPDDGGKIIKRALDDPGVIKVRLGEYENRTVPAIKYIQQRGLDIIDIPGENTIEAVANDIWRELQKYIIK